VQPCYMLTATILSEQISPKTCIDIASLSFCDRLDSIISKQLMCLIITYRRKTRKVGVSRRGWVVAVAVKLLSVD